MRRFSFFFVGVLALTCLVLAALDARAQGGGAANPEAKRLKNPVAATPASVAAGAAAYKKYCAFCHGASGKGDGPLAPKDPPPKDLTDATWDYGSTDGEIFTTITGGLGPDSKMTALKGKMPDQDIWHIVNYLRSLGPKTAAR